MNLKAFIKRWWLFILMFLLNVIIYNEVVKSYRRLKDITKLETNQ